MNIGTKKKHKWILTEKIGPGLKTHCDIILRYMREIKEGIKPGDITHELGMHCPGQNGERLYDLALTAFYTLETCGLIYADKSGRYYLVKDK